MRVPSGRFESERGIATLTRAIPLRTRSRFEQ
jgi:hypothetical protein